MSDQTSLLISSLRGSLTLDEPMARHVSWRAGGAAARSFRPADLDDLIGFLRLAPPKEPVILVGLGSNLLVRDGGFAGTVVFTHGVLDHIDLMADDEAGPLLYAQAGVAAPKVSRFAARHDLVGAEFMAGIPGTVGGALAMNAGCYGSETWDIVAGVTTLERNGELRERALGDFEIGYRHVALKDEGFDRGFEPHAASLSNGEGMQGRARPARGRMKAEGKTGANPGAAASEDGLVNEQNSEREIDGAREGSLRPSSFVLHPYFVAARFRLLRGDGELSRQRVKEYLSRRIATQPLGQPNAGSVFRNPPGDHAARLIEVSGLKGFAIGGAEVSAKHANFIVNLGQATAADIEGVIDHVHATVLARHGVDLVREVRIIGERS